MTSTATTRPQRIVVGVDFSELADLALERACDLARAYERTHVHVIHSRSAATLTGDLGPGSPAVAPSLKEASDQVRTHVEEVVRGWCEKRGSAVPFERLTTHVRADDAAESIAQLASDVEADLVVVGTHGRRGARRFFLGSVAEVTVRLAPCAVLVVRPPEASVPSIEPPCPRCLEVRRTSEGKELWCEQHREHHDRRHTYHYGPGRGAHQSGLLIHTS